MGGGGGGRSGGGSSPLGLAYVARLAREEAATEAADEAQGTAPAVPHCHESHDDHDHDAGAGSLVALVRPLAASADAAASAMMTMAQQQQQPAPASPPVVVTLLPRFGMEAGLQVAAAQDPRRPAVRLHVAASPLRVEFSPWRFHRLMAVVGSLSTTTTTSSGGSATATPGRASGPAAPALPLWVTDAEYVAPVELLSWEGVGGRVARWQPRSLSVWRGRVYLSSDDKGQSEALETR